MRAKFNCNTVTFWGDPNDPNASREYKLFTVYDDGTPENQRFSKASPSGEMTLRVDNPAARMTPGKQYYIDITEVGAPEATVEDHSRDVNKSGHDNWTA